MTFFVPPIVVLLLGLAILVAGADILVRNATRLAELVGVSPLMIGLTVVALGTSSPELAIALRSALNGAGDMALGNVVGSNIINILLILGVAALIRPVRVSEQLIRLDVPVMFAVSLVTLLLASDNLISLSDGLLLTFLGLVWLARDIDRGVSNRSAAQSIAFQAARSGAQQTSIADLRGRAAITVDPRAATAAATRTAEALFAEYDLDGELTSVMVDLDAVSVALRVTDGEVAVTGSATVRAERAP